MAASVCVVVLPDFAGVVLVWSVEPCCVLADEVDDEPDDELDEEALVELLLSVLLLAASWLFVDGSGGGGASCTLDESAEDDESDPDGEGGGENDGAGGVLAICAAALFCRSMLCCKVCENGLAFAAAAIAALVDVLLAEPSSEPICERSDIGNPVNPSNGVFGQSRRCPGASDALDTHPQNAGGVFV